MKNTDKLKIRMLCELCTAGPLQHFSKSSVDAVYSDAQAHGANIVRPIMDREWKARDFRVADPDGYFVRFTTPLPSMHKTE